MTIGARDFVISVDLRASILCRTKIISTQLISPVMHFSVFTAIRVQIVFFWIVTPCSILGRCRRLRRTCCFSLQGQIDYNQDAATLHRPRHKCRSQWPRGLRRRSAVARLLRLLVRIAPGATMFFCCECCVLSDGGLYDKLITRPEECVWSRNFVNEDARAHWMLSLQKQTKKHTSQVVGLLRTVGNNEVEGHCLGQQKGCIDIKTIFKYISK